MSHALRENDDGTVSVLGASGAEIIRGKPPANAANTTGVAGFQAMYHQKVGVVLRCLRNNARFFKRAVHLETFEAADLGDGTHISVTATWAKDGAWSKEYPLADMPAACGMKRMVLSDLLGARGVA